MLLHKSRIRSRKDVCLNIFAFENLFNSNGNEKREMKTEFLVNSFRNRVIECIIEGGP